MDNELELRMAAAAGNWDAVGRLNRRFNENHDEKGQFSSGSSSGSEEPTVTPGREDDAARGVFTGDSESAVKEDNKYTDPNADFFYRGTSGEEVKSTLNGKDPGQAGTNYWSGDFDYSSGFADGYAGGGAGYVMIADPAGGRVESAKDVVAVLQAHTGKILWSKENGFQHDGFKKFVEGSKRSFFQKRSTGNDTPIYVMRHGTTDANEQVDLR